MIAGTVEIDVADWRKNTEYRSGKISRLSIEYYKKFLGAIVINQINCLFPSKV